MFLKSRGTLNSCIVEIWIAHADQNYITTLGKKPVQKSEKCHNRSLF